MDLYSTGNSDGFKDGDVSSELGFDCSPWSKESSDSGAGMCLVSDKSDFLSELLGSDIGLCSDKQCAPRHVTSEKKPRTAAQDETQWQRNQRNAVAARQNRLKKKQYVLSLQTEIAQLKAENTVLKTKCRDLDTSVAQLSNEAEYFKSVLANQSMLSGLLQKMPTIKEVRFPTFVSCKREGEPFVDGVSPAKKPSLSGGVCLHVSQDVATLEFCSLCSGRAAHVLS